MHAWSLQTFEVLRTMGRDAMSRQGSTGHARLLQEGDAL